MERMPPAGPMPARPSLPSLLLGWLLAGATIALFCALGAWQLGRMQAKRAMLDQVHDVLESRTPAAPPGPPR